MWESAFVQRRTVLNDVGVKASLAEPGFFVNTAHPSIKILHRFYLFFKLCVKKGRKMLEWPSWSGEFGTFLWLWLLEIYDLKL